MSLPIEVLAGAVRGGTSIVYAATGDTVSERAGIVYLGTEGSMLAGAMTGYAVTAQSGNPWVGAGAALLAGGALALVHAFFVITRKANQLATGLVVLFLGLGLTSMFGAAYVAKPIKSFTPWRVPLLGSIPGVGNVLFNHDPLTYVSYGLVPLTFFVLFRSRFGILLRGVGERSEVVAINGYSVARWQYIATVTAGMFAGLGGAHLSTAYANAWFENMVQGRGFVAVAVVIFGARQPFKVAAGSYLYGGALALSPALQARGWAINQFALDAMPYVIILLVLMALGRRRLDDTPEGLKKVFELSPSS